MTDLNNTKTKGFEELLEFPCLFVFRAVSDSSEETLLACRQAVAATVSRRVESIELKPSSKGNYRVIRIGVMVLSGSEIRQLYAALHAVDGVRMVL